jgi:hypothetical protein
MTAALREQYDAVAALLSAWARRREAGTRSPQERVGSVLQSFPSASRLGLRDALRRASSGRAEVALEAGYVLGPAVDTGTPVMWPVAAVTADERGTVGVRVALFFQHDGEVWCAGWRFETADAAGGPHPYLHAQHCNGWGGPSATTFLLPDQGQARSAPVNESEPAFPLRGSTCVGLVVGMVAALHGANEAGEVAADAGHDLRGGLRLEVRALLAGG